MLGLSLVRRWPVGQCCTEATPHLVARTTLFSRKANGSERCPWKDSICSWIRAALRLLGRLHWNLHVNSVHDQRRSNLAYPVQCTLYRSRPALISSYSDRLRIQLA
jgi:hypothetical protein